MSKQREALELALEALQWNWGGEPLPTKELEAINAIREALAEPEQEPLTDEEINSLGDKIANEKLVGPVMDFRVRLARAIERAHGIGD